MDCRSYSFEHSDDYYTRCIDHPKLTYDYWLKRDLNSMCKARTLPRNLGSSINEGARVYPETKVFYEVEGSPYKRRPHRFVVKADIEAPR